MKQSNDMEGFIKEESTLEQDQMNFILKTIDDDISENFPKTNKDFYIYKRYNPNTFTLKIFINVFITEDDINSIQENNIYFLIIITSSYPGVAPVLYCISSDEFPSLCDRKDLRRCLINEWKPSYKISSFIKLLPNFIKNVKHDIKNNLLIYYGDYYKEKTIFSVNDFAINPEILIQKVKVITNADKNNKYIFEDKYIVITDIYFILLAPTSKNDTTFCTIEFYEELLMIEMLQNVPLLEENLNKEAYSIKWKHNMKEQYNNAFIVDEPIKLNDGISERQRKISSFKYVHGNKDNDIQLLNEVIKMKEDFLEICYNYCAYKCINEMYNRIIDLHVEKKEDDKLANYLNKMHELFQKYSNN